MARHGQWTLEDIRMKWDWQDKYEIHRQAWQAVKKKYGGIRKYSLLIKKAYSTVYDWFTKPEMEVPMEHLVEIELDTGIPIECLAPFREKETKMMRRWQAQKQRIS